MDNPIHLADDNALPIVIENHSQLPLNLTQSVATTFNSTMIDINEHETHSMRCKECNKELQVNNNYNIESITCGECWAKANPRDAYYTQPK